MTGYFVVNLKEMVAQIGEEKAKSLLSDFSCPLNADVENFLRIKAIEFAERGWAQTHLVFTSYRENPVLIGYFTLANKMISIPKKRNRVNSSMWSKLKNFSSFDARTRSYYISAPLIAQLGKNYTNKYDKLISGAELLRIAIDLISQIQLALGGRFIYVECEDKPKLIEFYTSAENGFCEFDTRPLDRDETDVSGEYLVQLIRYIK